MPTLDEAALEAGEATYYTESANAATRNPSAPVPQGETIGVPTNYTGNGDNDFWNKADALEQAYAQYFPEDQNIDFAKEHSPQNADFATQMIDTVTSIELAGTPDPGVPTDFLALIPTSPADAAAKTHDIDLGEAEWQRAEDQLNNIPTWGDSDAAFQANYNFAVTSFLSAAGDWQNHGAATAAWDIISGAFIGAYGQDAGILNTVDDEQNEFGKALGSWHGLFSNASGDVIEWVGERYSLQWTPGSRFVMKPDVDSAGIQMADLALWLYGQFLKGKELPKGCGRLLALILDRGWHNDFSFAGVEAAMMEQWGEVFFGPIQPEKLEEAAKMLKKAEERRLASMAQYEVDGLPPFARPQPIVESPALGT